jgi:hypothetical protein
VLMIISVHSGTRIFSLWFGHSCTAAFVGLIVQFGVFQNNRTNVLIAEGVGVMYCALYPSE